MPDFNLTKKWTKKLTKEMMGYLNDLMPPKETITPDQLQSWIALHSMIDAHMTEHTHSVKLPSVVTYADIEENQRLSLNMSLDSSNGNLSISVENTSTKVIPHDTAIRLHKILSSFLAKSIN